MQNLLPSTENQTIQIIPRVYSENIAMSLRDDSTNEVVLVYPETVAINKNYLDITTVFDLKEGHFYDVKIYLGDYARRLEADKGTIEALQCLGTIYNDSQIIYRDKIFCTIQGIEQTEGNKYTVNKDVYKEQSGNNDFIIL